MKRILAMLAMVALVVAPVLAEEAVVAKDVMTLKGKITKTEAEKDGKKVVTFTLATADAKIDLPAPKDGIKDDVLNVDVEVVAKAVTGADKKVTVKEVVSIKKLEVKAEIKAEIKAEVKEAVKGEVKEVPAAK